MTFSTKRMLFARFSRSIRHDERMSGFTLTELLITIAIAAILAAVAVPSFRTMNHNMAVRGAADELVAGIQFARSEAIRVNQTVSLALDGRTWQVFIDTNKNHEHDDDEILLREGAYSDLISPQDGALWFEFAPTGMITSAKPFPVNICLQTADAERLVSFPTRATSPVIQTSCP